MKNARIFFFFFIQFISLQLFADNDSLFIADVKQFVFKEIGMNFKGDFFTEWNTSDQPYYYLYVSLPDKVEKPKEFSSSFTYCRQDERCIRTGEKEFQAQGYQTFCYKTYANSGTSLNKRFISYSPETKSFIIFHELIHNYISQKGIEMPYEFNEALSDVIGNYGTLKYFRDNNRTDLVAAENQIRRNEKIYSYMNSAIKKINRHPEKKIRYYTKCREKIHVVIKNATQFQNDRFNYEVNNAFLLKNLYYCKNYFLLKKVFLRQKSIKDFLEIIQHIPGEKEDCIKYLQKFT